MFDICIFHFCNLKKRFKSKVFAVLSMDNLVHVTLISKPYIFKFCSIADLNFYLYNLFKIVFYIHHKKKAIEISCLLSVEKYNIIIQKLTPKKCYFLSLIAKKAVELGVIFNISCQEQQVMFAAIRESTFCDNCSHMKS